MDGSTVGLAMLIGVLIGSALFLLAGLALYIYMAVILMAIAKKTKTKDGWFAWIPILNLYLMTKIAKVSPWTMLVFLIMFVPFLNYIGSLIMLGVFLWWWWKIAEACKKPGWYAILLLIPIINLIIMGILAWGKK